MTGGLVTRSVCGAREWCRTPAKREVADMREVAVRPGVSVPGRTLTGKHTIT